MKRFSKQTLFKEQPGNLNLLTLTSQEVIEQNKSNFKTFHVEIINRIGEIRKSPGFLSMLTLYLTIYRT